MPQTDNESYEFSGFQLDVRERLLIRDGKRIPLSDKAFDTLCVLVEQAGHLVSKQHLMSRVWPDTFVEENNLDKSVSMIRHALDERQSKQKFVETVRGHGYRFIAEVKKLESSGNESEKEHVPAAVDLPVPAIPEPDQNRPSIAKFGTAFAIALIFVVGLGLLWRTFEKRKDVAGPAQKITSLAVLPLKDIGGKGEDYFADGMTEELITRLAGISEIRVISRSSVHEYKSTTKTIPEIGKELEADAILKGSILRIGNRVRITAQLIHAATDVHLWAQSYERDLKDILILQNEVASAIAREVQARIMLQESIRFANAPQMNPQAYDAYLRGLYYADREITEENLRLAAQMFEKAVELDHTFAIAYAHLSRAHSFLFFTFDRNPDRLTRSKAALDQALKLQPGLAEGHLALASYYYWGFRDYDRALQELDLAEKQLPNSQTIVTLQGTILRRQGRWQEALIKEEKAVQINPRHAMTLFDIGFTLLVLRRYEEAQKYFDRAISLAPDEQNSYFCSIRNQILWKGDNASARKILEKGPEKQNSRLIQERYWTEFLDRNYEAALQILSGPQIEPSRKYLLTGLVYRQLGKHKLALTSFHTARQEILKELEDDPKDYRLRGLLGIALAGLGQKEEAIREGKLAADLIPIQKDALWGSEPLIDLAAIYLMVYEPNLAMDQLEYLLSIPSLVSVAYLRVHPLWDPLRDHPRFKKITATERKS